MGSSDLVWHRGELAIVSLVHRWKPASKLEIYQGILVQNLQKWIYKIYWKFVKIQNFKMAIVKCHIGCNFLFSLFYKGLGASKFNLIFHLYCTRRTRQCPPCPFKGPIWRPLFDQLHSFHLYLYIQTYTNILIFYFKNTQPIKL